MKKKIIYFCCGVLLTTLILVALQTFAAAPNPGHDASQLSGDINALTFSGKGFITMNPVAGGTLAEFVLPSPTGNAFCAAKGLTCSVAYDSNWASWSLANCSYNYATINKVRCDCTGCSSPMYR